MKITKSITLVLITLVVLSCFISIYKVENAATTSPNPTPYNWWMLGNGPTHTGYSSSTGPLTNDVLWSKSTNDLEMDLSGCATPVVAAGVIYLKYPGTIYALDAYNSTLIRSYDLGSSYSCQQSPAVVNGVLYTGTGTGEVLAFNTTSGDTIWNYMTGGGILSSPSVENGVLYIGSIDGNLYALNATAGILIWSYQTDDRVNYSPAVSNGVVVVGSDDGNLYAMDAQTGSQLWNYSTGYSYSNEAPCIVGDVVYAGQYYSSDGNFSALSLTTGEKIWSISKSVWGSVAVNNGTVYLNANDGNTYAVNATTGAQIWSYTTSASYNSPIIACDVVYAQSTSNLYALNATNGDLIWSRGLFSMMGGVSSPVIAAGIVYVTIDSMMSGTIYAFGSIVTYTLTLNTVGHGTVSPGNQTYNAGVSIDLNAIPDAGWSFANWTGDASGTTNTTVTMTGNLTVNATFTQNSHNLTMITIGQGNVFPGNQTLPSGTNVTIWANTVPGWSLQSFSGDISENDTTVTLNRDMVVNVTFTQDTYTLTMVSVGNGTVLPGNQSYLFGTTVDLKAIPANNWNFSGWTGDISGTTNTTITMDTNKTVTATFLTTTLIATKTTDNQTYTVSVTDGNITATQFSNMTITPYAGNASTVVAFTLTGTSGTNGTGTIAIPKEAIPHGTIPKVYIDGVLAENQAYTQDDNYYYVTFSTHFSTHQIDITFSEAPAAAAVSSGSMTTTEHPSSTATPLPSPSATPLSTPTPQPTTLPTDKPTVSPTAIDYGLWLYLLLVVVSFVGFFIIAGISYRRIKGGK
jgi:eukaryotic-like serine/threonine-protein kinase